jgi:MFS family permease
MHELTRDRRDRLLINALAALKLLFHVLTNGQYGFHRDELATLSDARHLAWGFVAYPPLTPFIGRVALTLFGTSLTGFRFFAAAGMSIVIVIAAAIARRLGGGLPAQLTAAAAVAIAPLLIAASALFQYVAFDALWTVLLAYFLVRLIESDNQRWWFAIGLTIGLGALTKYTIAFVVAGLVAAVLFTPLRQHLRGRWLWIGAALSFAIAAPHFLWQWQHHWITLDFLKSIHARDVRIGRTSRFYIEQLYVCANPITIPLWIAGLVALVTGERFRRYRPLAWLVVVPFALFAIAHGRSYYTAPLYVPLLAVGAVQLERALAPRGTNVRRVAWSAIAILLIAGSSMALLLLPLARVGSPLWLRANAVNGDLREEIGWPELSHEVARIASTLPAEERRRGAVLCLNYGEAGALELYGSGDMRLIASVNSFWLRGYGTPPQTVIALGFERDDLETLFGSVTVAGKATNRFGVKNEESADHPDIFVCRNARSSWDVMWQRLRNFG